MGSSATWQIQGGTSSLRALHEELCGFFLKRVGDPDLAEDLAQQTWLSGEHFKGRSTLRFYLYRVARNVLVTLYRRRERDGEVAAVDTEIDELIMHATSVGTKVDRAAERAVLEATLEELPEGFRRAFELSVLGYTGEEIAELLDISPHTVRSRVSRVRTRLREAISTQR